ncbi:PLP-dependent decarboxylase [Thalassomonas viridans]|uniref:PLP-dependent decarboxylase n=1 Tax=Thalassomonas viridans TaxID=137584 RepID=A0AAE9Z183_9GAMM|nr:PLP-dependent decarboxylase [Thalassomonas viridans]WDE04956.1 PLP-dependent decarboxylase [Thalassomonas viridans]
MKNSPLWFDEEIRPLLQGHHSGDPHENGYFVYHLDALKAHLARLQQQDVVKLWFAVKANPLSRVIRTFADAGFNFDVASSGELAQVLSQGVEPAQVLNTGPAKSKKQLAAFLAQGVNTFVIESLNQLHWLNEAALAQEVRPQVLLRVQLQWPEGEKNPLGGNEVTPFGLSVHQWCAVKVADFPALDICGLHIFQWGNMLSNEQMFALWSQMASPLLALAQEIGMDLKILDLGGGLGIDYLQQGRELNWQQALEDLARIKQQAGVEDLWLELGRYAVAGYGYYLAPVVDRKCNFDRQQLVLAGGINHLLRPAITGQAFPVTLLRQSQQALIPFDIHGPLCTSMDKLGQLPLPGDVGVADQLVFGYCGAYGFTESMPFFLCHQIAAEYVYEQGTLQQVRPAEPATWYMR